MPLPASSRLEAVAHCAGKNVICFVLVMQWDFEVRDRVLSLMEDFGRGLPLPAYREAYEGLVVSVPDHQRLCCCNRWTFERKNQHIMQGMPVLSVGAVCRWDKNT